MSEVVTESYPSREEWTQRQSQMPQGMRDAIAEFQAAQDAEEADRRERFAARKVAIAHRLFTFEVAVSQVIQGQEWLNVFRVKNPVELAGDAFSGEHRHWIAVFDLAAVGGHRFWISIGGRDNGNEFLWLPGQYTTFTVKSGRSTRGAENLAHALWLCTQYEPTPF